MKINKSLIEAKWIEFKEAKGVSFKIRPFPVSHNVIRTSIAKNDQVESFFKIFDYCVVDWKGINGEDDKPLECNTENKKFLFDYSESIMMFVINKSAEDKDKIIEKKT